MSTFLQLVNDVERESGVVNQAFWLTTIVGATGKQKKIVEWVRQAWEMIQRERTDWTFRRKQFSNALTIGVSRYTATALNITDFAGWMRETEGFRPFTLYNNAIGRSDETELAMLRHRDWLIQYDRGSPASMRPCVCSFSQDRELLVGPPPDKAYIVRGWYRRSIQSLAANTDVPIIDAEFHQAIVWRACMLLGDEDEAAFEVASSRAQYLSIYSAMVAEYTDPIELA